MKEIKENIYLYADIEDSILKQRISNALNWNIKKAVWYKRFYYIFACLSTIAPLLVTVLHSLDSDVFVKLNIQTYSAVLATITTMSSSFLALFHFKDQWREHRDIAEEIKAELIKFHMKSGNYKSGDLSVLGDSIQLIIIQGTVKETKIIDSPDKTS